MGPVRPSLIWLPFGKRRPTDITFPLAPPFEAHGIDFVHAEATASEGRSGERPRRPGRVQARPAIARGLP